MAYWTGRPCATGPPGRRALVTFQLWQGKKAQLSIVMTSMPSSFSGASASEASRYFLQYDWDGAGLKRLPDPELVCAAHHGPPQISESLAARRRWRRGIKGPPDPELLCTLTLPLLKVRWLTKHMHRQDETACMVFTKAAAETERTHTQLKKKAATEEEKQPLLAAGNRAATPPHTCVLAGRARNEGALIHQRCVVPRLHDAMAHGACPTDYFKPQFTVLRSN